MDYGIGAGVKLIEIGQLRQRGSELHGVHVLVPGRGWSCVLLCPAGGAQWPPVPLHEGCRLCHEPAGPLLRLVGGGGGQAAAGRVEGGLVSGPCLCLPLPSTVWQSSPRGPPYPRCGQEGAD